MKNLCWLIFATAVCFLPALSYAQEATLMVHGTKRTFILRIPESAARLELRPAVIAFHGGGGEALGFEHTSGLTETARRNGFIVVYPQGTGPKADKFLTWNAGPCCGKAKEDNVDDVTFTEELIEELIRHYRVDPQRIFATGISNGAMMSYRVACELSTKIAAVAPVAISSGPERCEPSRPVPIFHVQGSADPCAPLKGGTCGGCFERYFQAMFFIKPRKDGRWHCPSVPETLDKWRQINGCSRETKSTHRHGDTHCEQIVGCKENADIELCVVDGGGHTWPGGGSPNVKCEKNSDRRACRLYDQIVGKTSEDFDASEMMWKFFAAHPLPERFTH